MATGRRYGRTLHLVEPLRIDVPLVTASGALVKDPANHRTLFQAQFDRPVLCEALAVVDWVQTIADMKRTCDWVMVLGANLLSLHGQHYSIDGLRKFESPQSQFYHAGYRRFFL